MTNLEIDNAYVGTDLVEKIYIGSELVWGGEGPEPTLPYSAMPLTFKVLSAGTIQFARYDSTARTADTCEFTYKLNGVPGTFETYDTTPLIVNVQAGDFFEIYGKPATDFQKLGVGDGQTGGNTSYHSFSGSSAVMEVYGNLMSMCVPLSNIVANNIDRWDTAAQYAGVSDTSYVITSLLRNMPGLVSAENLWVPYDVPDFGYLNLFKGSDALTVGPILQAEETATWCYASMYSGCSSLNDIVVTANPNGIPAGSNWSMTWVNGVASNGNFYVHPDVFNWGYQNFFTSGQIPSGWDVYPADGFRPSTIYLPTGQPLYDVTVKVFYPDDIEEVTYITTYDITVENQRYEDGYLHFDVPFGYDGTIDGHITMDIMDKWGQSHSYTLTIKKEKQYEPVDLYNWLQQQQGTIITGTLGTVLYIPTATTIWGSSSAGYLSADPSTPSTASSNYSVRFQNNTKYPSVKQRGSGSFVRVSNAPTKTINGTLCYEYTFNEPLYIAAQSTATSSWRQQISRNEVYILQPV